MSPFVEAWWINRLALSIVSGNWLSGDIRAPIHTYKVSWLLWSSLGDDGLPEGTFPSFECWGRGLLLGDILRIHWISCVVPPCLSRFCQSRKGGEICNLWLSYTWDNSFLTLASLVLALILSELFPWKFTYFCPKLRSWFGCPEGLSV